MTGVTQKTSYDPAAQFEDDTSVPVETKGTTATATKTAEPGAPKSGDVDTFETVKADPRRAELEAINAERRKLKPELEKKETEAQRSLPKLIPGLGTVSDVTFAIWDAGRAMARLDGTGTAKAAASGAKSVAEDKAIEIASEKAEAVVAKKVSEAAGEVAGKAVGSLAVLKDAYEIHTAMSEYGALVKKDEELKHRAEELEMELDPSKKFKLIKVGSETFSRQDGKLVSDEKKSAPTEAQKALCERLAKGK